SLTAVGQQSVLCRFHRSVEQFLARGLQELRVVLDRGHDDTGEPLDRDMSWKDGLELVAHALKLVANDLDLARAVGFRHCVHRKYLLLPLAISGAGPWWIGRFRPRSAERCRGWRERVPGWLSRSRR